MRLCSSGIAALSSGITWSVGPPSAWRATRTLREGTAPGVVARAALAGARARAVARPRRRARADASRARGERERRRAWARRARLHVLDDGVASAMVVPLAVVVELIELDPPRALRGVMGGAGAARARLRRARAAGDAGQVVETNDSPPFATLVDRPILGLSGQVLAQVQHFCSCGCAGGACLVLHCVASRFTASLPRRSSRDIALRATVHVCRRYTYI